MPTVHVSADQTKRLSIPNILCQNWKIASNYTQQDMKTHCLKVEVIEPPRCSHL